MTTPQATQPNAHLVIGAAALAAILGLGLPFLFSSRPAAMAVPTAQVEQRPAIERSLPTQAPPAEPTAAPVPTEVGYLEPVPPQLAPPPAAPALVAPASAPAVDIFANPTDLQPIEESAVPLCSEAGRGPCKGERP